MNEELKTANDRETVRKKDEPAKRRGGFFYLLFWMGLSICNGNENNDYKIELKLNKQMHLSQCK